MLLLYYWRFNWHTKRYRKREIEFYFVTPYAHGNIKFEQVVYVGVRHRGIHYTVHIHNTYTSNMEGWHFNGLLHSKVTDMHLCSKVELIFTVNFKLHFKSDLLVNICRYYNFNKRFMYEHSIHVKWTKWIWWRHQTSHWRSTFKHLLSSIWIN